MNGKPYEVFDEAGKTTFSNYDFKGNTLSKTRAVIADSVLQAALSTYTTFVIDWTSPPALSTMLFTTDMSYDALNRVTELTLPIDLDSERKKIRPTYNTAGALEKVDLYSPAGGGTSTNYVENIAYNAKGQRLLIAFGNGVMTRYAYDGLTFRLLRQRSEKYSKTTVGNTITYSYVSSSLRQDDGFDYDLIGNIVTLLDRMTNCGIGGTPNALDKNYDYDPIYRLTYADGRESDTQSGNSYLYDDAPAPTDLTHVRAYSRTYSYDKLGNVLNVVQAGTNGFTRHFVYNTGQNTLNKIDTGGGSPSLIEDYTYDSNGNQITAGVSRNYSWNHSDQLICYKNQVGTSNPTIYTQYDYAGQDRVSKLVRTGTSGSPIYQRTIYIDGIFEYVKLENGTTYEKNYIHMMDDKSRIAEVRIGDIFPGDITDDVTYIIEDQIGSSVMRTDVSGNEIDREEYYPFGDSSLRTFSYKRYRYVGKEKDSESGLYYYGARYYAAWTCRFISVDPKAQKYKDLSGYVYADNKPIMLIDVFGEGPGPSDKRIILYSVNNHDKTETESFKKAGWKLRDDYNQNSKTYGNAKASASEVSNGNQIVSYINQQKTDSIKSLDIFSHGSRQGIWFANTENVQDNSKRGNLYRTSADQYKENATTNFKSKNIADIDYSKFTSDARIEIHGCETGGSAVEVGDTNIGRSMSSLLYSAGKIDAVVIANFGKSGPTDSGDYRQEGNIRIVYWNGEELFRTTKGGNISDNEIQQAIQNKIQQTNGNTSQQKAPTSSSTYQTATPGS
jgi:RHS repeat-associated protein